MGKEKRKQGKRKDRKNKEESRGGKGGVGLGREKEEGRGGWERIVLWYGIETIEQIKRENYKIRQH